MQNIAQTQNKLPKVYLATEENKKRFNDAELVFLSLDGKYLVVYTKEALYHRDQLLKWVEMYDNCPSKFIYKIGEITEETIVIIINFHGSTMHFAINRNDDLTTGLPVNEFHSWNKDEKNFIYLVGAGE